MIDWTQGHSSPRWDLVFTHIGQTVDARYPQGQEPSLIPGNPLILNTVDTTAGWVGDNNGQTPTPILNPVIAPYSSYGSGAASASWLVNEAEALVYRAHNAADANGNTSTVSILPTDYSIDIGESLELTITTGSLDLSSINNITVYHGSVQIDYLDAAEVAATNLIQYTPTETGIHSFVAAATYLDPVFGWTTTSNYCAAFIQPAAVPEPTATILFCLAGVTTVLKKRRRA